MKPQVKVDIYQVQLPEEIEKSQSQLDQMWSYVSKKDTPRWLWDAIDHQTGKVLAYVFDRRKNQVFLQLKAHSKRCGISRFYTDGIRASERPKNSPKAWVWQAEYAEDRK